MPGAETESIDKEDGPGDNAMTGLVPETKVFVIAGPGGTVEVGVAVHRVHTVTVLVMPIVDTVEVV